MTLTKTGATARNVSKFRPQTPILAVTPHVHVARQLQLVWGVRPLLVSRSALYDSNLPGGHECGPREENAQEGDLVVLTAGTLQGVSGSTDLIKVDVVTAVLGRGVGIGEASVSGRARVAQTGLDLNDFNDGEILVAPRTSADFVDAIRRSGGIITEDDSLTGHAAVIGLRLGVPVIVGVKNATEMIRDGTILTLDARRGLVYSGALGPVKNEPAMSV
jgi:pyruvate kinase